MGLFRRQFAIITAVGMSTVHRVSASPSREAVFTSGQINRDTHHDANEALSASQLLKVSDWLTKHRDGWALNVVTRPPPKIIISLDTAAQATAARLLIWRDHERSTVLLEMPAGKPVGVQTIPSSDSVALLG